MMMIRIGTTVLSSLLVLVFTGCGSDESESIAPPPEPLSAEGTALPGEEAEGEAPPTATNPEEESPTEADPAEASEPFGFGHIRGQLRITDDGIFAPGLMITEDGVFAPGISLTRDKLLELKDLDGKLGERLKKRLKELGVELKDKLKDRLAKEIAIRVGDGHIALHGIDITDGDEIEIDVPEIVLDFLDHDRDEVMEKEVEHSSHVTCCEGDCETRCPPGEQCRATCSGGGCNQVCSDKADCYFTCAGGDCVQRCEGTASCRFTCSGGDCHRECADTADCKMTCSGDACSVGK